MTGVTCQVSGVKCQVSGVRCHMSGVTCLIKKKNGSGVSRWRVCYQRSLPRLVSGANDLIKGWHYDHGPSMGEGNGKKVHHWDIQNTSDTKTLVGQNVQVVSKLWKFLTWEHPNGLIYLSGKTFKTAYDSVSPFKIALMARTLQTWRYTKQTTLVTAECIVIL